MRPAPRRRRALSVALALVAVAELGTGTAVAANLRHDQARARAAAAERKAAQHYVAAVRPLALRVFDAVQPMQDVSDAFANLRPGLLAARDDVLANSGALAELTAVRDQLAAQPVPATYRVAAKDLTSSLDDLIAATGRLAKATKARPDRDGFVAEMSPAFDALFSGESLWGSAMSELTQPTPVPVPAANRGGAFGRNAPTRGSFIQGADLACASSAVALGSLRELSVQQEVLVNFPREAAILRTALAKLRAVKAPASQTAMGHRLEVQLRSALLLSTSFTELSTALRKHDLSSYRAGLRNLHLSLNALRELSATYRSAGALECAYFFAVDDTGRSKQRAPLAA